VEIFREAIPFFVVRVSDYLIQGLLIIVLSSRMNSREIIAFTTLKTLFRLGPQFLSLIQNTAMYELTSNWAIQNREQMRRILRLTLIFSLIFIVLMSIIYLTFGKDIYGVWTNDQVEIDTQIIELGIVYSILVSLSQLQKNKFHAVNDNFRVSMISLTSATVMLLYVVTLENIEVERMLTLLILMELLNMLFTHVLTFKLKQRLFN
jgi:O-antigen/teichoic acid export membrane protein